MWCWMVADACFQALSSQDGFCTLVEFEKDELGSQVPFSGRFIIFVSTQYIKYPY